MKGEGRSGWGEGSALILQKLPTVSLLLRPYPSHRFHLAFLIF